MSNGPIVKKLSDEQLKVLRGGRGHSTKRRTTKKSSKHSTKKWASTRRSSRHSRKTSSHRKSTRRACR